MQSGSCAKNKALVPEAPSCVSTSRSKGFSFSGIEPGSYRDIRASAPLIAWAIGEWIEFVSWCFTWTSKALQKGQADVLHPQRHSCSGGSAHGTNSVHPHRKQPRKHRSPNLRDAGQSETFQSAHDTSRQGSVWFTRRRQSVRWLSARLCCETPACNGPFWLRLYGIRRPLRQDFSSLGNLRKGALPTPNPSSPVPGMVSMP